MLMFASTKKTHLEDILGKQSYIKFFKLFRKNSVEIQST